MSGFLYIQQKVSWGFSKKISQKHEKFTFRKIRAKPANQDIAGQRKKPGGDRKGVQHHSPATWPAGAEMGMARTPRKKRGRICHARKRSNTSQSYPQPTKIMNYDKYQFVLDWDEQKRIEHKESAIGLRLLHEETLRSRKARGGFIMSKTHSDFSTALSSALLRLCD